MKIGSHQWVLFGYDLRTLGGVWRMAWRELLWNQNSRLRTLIDEPVRVYLPRETLNDSDSELLGCHRNEALAEGQFLPDEMVLSFWLNLPEQAEAELESAVALEVRAKSPYPIDDTCYGWQVAGRVDGVLKVCVAIVSRGGVMAYMHRMMSFEAASQLEVWVRVESLNILISGFGEGFRERRYRNRLKKLFVWCVYSLFIIVLLMAVPVMLRSIQADYYREELQKIQHSSAEAVRLRNELGKNNEYVQEIRRLMQAAGDPYGELLRLTYLLDDQIWLTSFDFKGERVRIEGMADNAADMMQLLSSQSQYLNVSSPTAIRRDQRADKERFVLDLRLASRREKP